MNENIQALDSFIERKKEAHEELRALIDDERWNDYYRGLVDSYGVLVDLYSDQIEQRINNK